MKVRVGVGGGNRESRWFLVLPLLLGVKGGGAWICCLGCGLILRSLRNSEKAGGWRAKTGQGRGTQRTEFSRESEERVGCKDLLNNINSV
jgi:hypothetical protein